MKENFRILIIYLAEPPLEPDGIMAGTGGTTIRRAEYLADNGHDVTVLTHLAGLAGQYHGVKYLDVKHWPSFLAAIQSLRQNWDVCVSVASPRILLQTYRIPNIGLRMLMIHVPPQRSIDQPPEKRRIKMMNRYADVLVSVSQAMADLLVKYGVRREKLYVVYNGVDEGIFHPYNLERKMNRLIFAGALVPHKGVETLLQAFRIARKVIPNLELVLCGSKDLWGAWARQNFLSDERLIPDDGSIQFLGKCSQTELAEEFSQAALAVFPSSTKIYFEAFGKVSIEAQACGCPVLVTKNGGLPETLLDRVTGRVCPVDNPDVLAKFIVRLVSDPDRLRAMGSAAQAHIQHNFLWKNTLQGLSDIIEQELRHGKLGRRIGYAFRLGGLCWERVTT